MPSLPPKNGPLSGMILPALAALVLPLAAVLPAFRGHFNAPLSPALLAAFWASAAVMALHKLESYYFGEFDQCPVYLTMGQSDWARNPRQMLFMGFVPTFIGMLFVAGLALAGPPWHLLIVTVWIAQGLHELHHSAKSAVRKRIYPGLFTSLVFVGVLALWIFPLWHRAVLGAKGIFFCAYYALIPVIWLGFYLEDRSWTRRADPTYWNP